MSKIKMNFLAAADGTALTKQYTKESNGTYSTHPYPNVRDFNSFEYEIENLHDWLEVLKAHSELGHCFLKGELSKKLANEPRAGRTNPIQPTQTILLDLDFNDGFRDIEDFLYQLDPMFADVSYIVHHSNSAGITGPVGLRAHIGILLDHPINPAFIKNWLQHKNLTVPALSKLIKLSANGLSLKYPLDVTTCQNDKLIYIARPDCVGFDDPLEDSRIELISKPKGRLTDTMPFINPEVIHELASERVKELREEQGLKPKKARMNGGKQLQVMLNPDKAMVTSVKAGQPFTYLNLNGGDSWGYWHNTDNPDLLYNFKGEDPCRLRDIVPDYYSGLVTTNTAASEEIPYVFRERTRDVYYNLLYNPATKDIDSLDKVSNKDKLANFMLLHNSPMPDPVEDWTIEFDPRTTEVLDERNRWVNSFKPTPFLKRDYGEVPRIPLIIDRILTSICVDEEYKAWFVNWLACLYQTRAKSQTCPLFHGVQGTGKGLLHEKVLMPLIGELHTPKVTTQQIRDQFNGWTERACVAVWDEAEQSNSFDTTTYDKVKTLITEEHSMIRLMQTNAFQVKSYLNLLVFTNHPFPFPLGVDDRRFCVAPPQLKKLTITEAEVNTIVDELPMFAAYLQHFNVNTQFSKNILYNEARTEMITGSANTVDTFFYAIRDGKLDYFLSFVRTQSVMTPDPIYNEFFRTLKRWALDCKNDNNHAILTRDEAMSVFSYVIKKYDSPAKFKKMGEKYHIEDGRGQVYNKQTRGWKVQWTCAKRELMEQLLEPDVKPIQAAS